MGRGGNAVVVVRFDIARFGACVQICAYGSACRVERDGKGRAGARWQGLVVMRIFKMWSDLGNVQ